MIQASHTFDESQSFVESVPTKGPGSVRLEFFSSALKNAVAYDIAEMLVVNSEVVGLVPAKVH
jgi:hypothetical protein